ncbi:MAG: murein transglycosylase A [Paracoccaceae bacterium]
MIRALCALVMAVSTMAPAAADPAIRYDIVSFDDLDGWDEDDHDLALSVFRNTCPDMKGADWSSLCTAAFETESARSFFEVFFRPVVMQDGAKPLFTGYFEPELSGDTRPSARYRYPLYRQPPEAKAAGRWLSRREIETGPAMQGKGLEIVWVDDPVEKFFLQVQGSGRVRLPDGRFIRVGYGGSNGHPYRSIGQELIRRGIYEPHQVSAQVIRNWVRRNPEDGQNLLFHNPSYVFFREVSHVPAHLGPLGAMNRSITAGRSIAVDPAFVPLGAPVWVEKGGAEPLHRLMIAQDTGSAIKGAQRADVFMGTGDVAGRAAGRLRDGGRMVVLLPIERAYALTPEAVR